jgi:hypothetical protein
MAEILNAKVVRIPKLLDHIVCMDAMRVLNEFKNTKITSTTFNPRTGKRDYVLVDDETNPFKYVGERLDSVDFFEGFIVNKTYYICNVPTIHKLPAETELSDLKNTIEKLMVYDFMKLPYIDFTLEKNNNEFVLEIKFNHSIKLPSEKLDLIIDNFKNGQA